jgi:hypothetical protein
LVQDGAPRADVFDMADVGLSQRTAPPPPPAPAPVPAGNEAAARRWAPFVAVVVLALVLNNVVQLVFNLDERHLQQRIARGEVTDPNSVRHMLSHIKATSNVSLVLALVFLAVAIIWTVTRRGRGSSMSLRGTTIRQRGPSLRQSEPVLWWAVMILIAVSWAITIHCNSLANAAKNPSDVATYRGYLALGDVVRAAMWAGWFVMVLLVTWSGRVAVTQQRNDLAGGIGNVGAGAEHGRHAGRV